jgi:hypothetical protein
MLSFTDKLLKLLQALPAILLLTFMNVFISGTTASVVMIQLLANWSLCQRHHWIALVLAIITAVVVYTWILFNYKLREYIKNKELVHE